MAAPRGLAGGRADLRAGVYGVMEGASEEQKARLAVLLAPAVEEYRRRKTP